MIIGGILLAVIFFLIGRASKKVTVTSTTTTTLPTDASGRIVAPAPANPALVGKWKQVDNLSTGACPVGSTSGKYLGEDPISYNNGNPVYRCYVSTANMG